MRKITAIALFVFSLGHAWAQLPKAYTFTYDLAGDPITRLGEVDLASSPITRIVVVSTSSKVLSPFNGNTLESERLELQFFSGDRMLFNDRHFGMKKVIGADQSIRTDFFIDGDYTFLIKGTQGISAGKLGLSFSGKILRIRQDLFCEAKILKLVPAFLRPQKIVEFSQEQGILSVDGQSHAYSRTFEEITDPGTSAGLIDRKIK